MIFPRIFQIALVYSLISCSGLSNRYDEEVSDCGVKRPPQVLFIPTGSVANPSSLRAYSLNSNTISPLKITPKYCIEVPEESEGPKSRLIVTTNGWTDDKILIADDFLERAADAPILSFEEILRRDLIDLSLPEQGASLRERQFNGLGLTQVPTSPNLWLDSTYIFTVWQDGSLILSIPVSPKNGNTLFADRSLATLPDGTYEVRYQLQNLLDGSAIKTGSYQLLVNRKTPRIVANIPLNGDRLRLNPGDEIVFENQDQAPLEYQICELQSDSGKCDFNSFDGTFVVSGAGNKTYLVVAADKFGNKTELTEINVEIFDQEKIDTIVSKAQNALEWAVSRRTDSAYESLNSAITLFSELDQKEKTVIEPAFSRLVFSVGRNLFIKGVFDTDKGLRYISSSRNRLIYEDGKNLNQFSLLDYSNHQTIYHGDETTNYLHIGNTERHPDFTFIRKPEQDLVFNNNTLEATRLFPDIECSIPSVDFDAQKYICLSKDQGQFFTQKLGTESTEAFDLPENLEIGKIAAFDARRYRAFVNPRDSSNFKSFAIDLQSADIIQEFPFRFGSFYLRSNDPIGYPNILYGDRRSIVNTINMASFETKDIPSLVRGTAGRSFLNGKIRVEDSNIGVVHFFNQQGNLLGLNPQKGYILGQWAFDSDRGRLISSHWRGGNIVWRRINGPSRTMVDLPFEGGHPIFRPDSGNPSYIFSSAGKFYEAKETDFQTVESNTIKDSHFTGAMRHSIKINDEQRFIVISDDGGLYGINLDGNLEPILDLDLLQEPVIDACKISDKELLIQHRNGLISTLQWIDGVAQLSIKIDQPLGNRRLHYSFAYCAENFAMVRTDDKIFSINLRTWQAQEVSNISKSDTTLPDIKDGTVLVQFRNEIKIFKPDGSEIVAFKTDDKISSHTARLSPDAPVFSYATRNEVKAFDFDLNLIHSVALPPKTFVKKTFYSNKQLTALDRDGFVVINGKLQRKGFGSSPPSQVFISGNNIVIPTMDKTCIFKQLKGGFEEIGVLNSFGNHLSFVDQSYFIQGLKSSIMETFLDAPNKRGQILIHPLRFDLAFDLITRVKESENISMLKMK